MLSSGRLRVAKACATCKKRKVKCDGKFPCSNCLRHGQECQYDYTSVKKRSKYKKARADGAPQHVPHDVEGHMAKLLLQLGSQFEKPEATAGGAPPSFAMDRPVHVQRNRCPWQSFSSDKYRFHRRYQNLLPYYLGASLLSELPPQTVSKYNLKQPRIQNYGWNLCGGHFLRHDANNSAKAKGSPLDHASLFDFDDPVHLSIVNKLLRFFFLEVNPALSVVHEPMFWQQFQNGFLNQSRQRNSSAKLFLSILYLILAISLRFQEGLLQDGTSGFFTVEETQVLSEFSREEVMFDYAYSIITKLTFEWESFELVQSWLLICFYFRTCYRQTACWNALSQAVSMCNGMSLYLDRFPEKHAKYDENRAWHCFWACFIMDKLITFQMGRFYQLPLPVTHMATPGNWPQAENEQKSDTDDWFHRETVQLFHLSLIIMDCQKKNGEELSLDESLDIKNRLNGWYEKYVSETKINKTWNQLCDIQPFISYLDVRLTFETRRLFLLINQPSVTTDMIFPMDTIALINHCQLSTDIMGQIFKRDLIFVPWWLNLSQLFTVSVICITLIHSGLQTDLSRTFLFRCMNILNGLSDLRPKNPPQMLPECLWCLRMLNHMCCMRLISSATHLEMLVGTDPGDSSPNNNRFSQFGKIGEQFGDGEVEDDDLEDSEEQEHDSNSPLTNSSVPSQQAIQLAFDLPSTVVAPLHEQQQQQQAQPNAQIPPKISNLMNPNFGQDTQPATDTNDSPSMLIDDSLFSYLQWFDQSFV